MSLLFHWLSYCTLVDIAVEAVYRKDGDICNHFDLKFLKASEINN